VKIKENQRKHLYFKEKLLIIEMRVVLAQISNIRSVKNARQGYHKIHIFSTVSTYFK